MGIPTGFSVGMGWAWGLKSNPHGSPAILVYILSFLRQYVELARLWLSKTISHKLIKIAPYHQRDANVQQGLSSFWLCKPYKVYADIREVSLERRRQKTVRIMR